MQEEVGLRGAKTSAYGIDPQIGIAVDVTHATDCPTIDRRQQGEVFLGKGPVICRGPNMNACVTEQLIATAEQHGIPFQLAAVGRASSNDANSIQVSRSGVATAVVAIPNRYMHSAVEMISLEDIDHAAELIAHFAAGITAEARFHAEPCQRVIMALSRRFVGGGADGGIDGRLPTLTVGPWRRSPPLRSPAGRRRRHPKCGCESSSRRRSVRRRGRPDSTPWTRCAASLEPTETNCRNCWISSDSAVTSGPKLQATSA